MAAVSGLDPSVLVAPDYQTQMMQAQRRLALSSALQQQAMTDTPGNGGSVSWTQGLARVLDGLFAGSTARAGYKQMQGANRGYAAGMARLFGMDAPQAPQGEPQPAQPPQQGAPPQGGSTAGADPLAPLPDAPPQAASPPPSAPPPAPTGGAPHSMFPTEPGLSTGQSMFHMMQDPEGYWKNIGAANSPTDFAKALTQAGIDPTGPIGRQLMQAQVAKQNYIAPTNARPGGWTIYPDGHKEFNPQAPIPGAVPGPPDADGNATWRVPAGTEAAVAARAKSQAAGQSAGQAPYQFQDVYNPATGQMEHVPVSEMVGSGGGSLNAHYGGGQGAPAGGHYAAAPPIGAVSAANTYGSGSAQGALDTQNSAEGSQVRVQAYREMQGLLNSGLKTGPTQARMQELAEEHGLSFLAKDNAFVFNKDAALAVAQQAKALGLNSSDARFEAVARATPNMKMTPQALAQVIPVRIGMEYASQAEATANANWVAQHGPQSNPQFKNIWRQSYDPRMFTAYAQGGPKALASAPANVRQQWLKDYRALKGMGVDFTQFAQ